MQKVLDGLPQGVKWNRQTLSAVVVATARFMEQLDSTIINTPVPSMDASLHVAPFQRIWRFLAGYVITRTLASSFSAQPALTQQAVARL